MTSTAKHRPSKEWLDLWVDYHFTRLAPIECFEDIAPFLRFGPECARETFSGVCPDAFWLALLEERNNRARKAEPVKGEERERPLMGDADGRD